jgi:hypothetical protein
MLIVCAEEQEFMNKNITGATVRFRGKRAMIDEVRRVAMVGFRREGKK